MVVGAGRGEGVLSPTLFCGSVEEGIVRLFVCCSERCEEIEEVALDLSGSGCRSVCFVENDEWSKHEGQNGKKDELNEITSSPY